VPKLLLAEHAFPHTSKQIRYDLHVPPHTLVRLNIYRCRILQLRWVMKMLLLIVVLQAGGCLGQDRGLPVCDRWRPNDRVASACHRVQLQLFLPPGNRPGGDAVAELQSRDQLSLPSRYIRLVLCSCRIQDLPDRF
jgi:hypothetical protein